MEWAHKIEFTASSAASFEPLDRPRCCRYKTTFVNTAGNTVNLCSVALLKDPKYLLVVELALDCKTVVGRALARSLRFSSSRFFRIDQWPDVQHFRLVNIPQFY